MDMVLMNKTQRNGKYYLSVYLLGCLVDINCTEDEYNGLTVENINHYLQPCLKQEGYRYYLSFFRVK